MSKITKLFTLSLSALLLQACLATTEAPTAPRFSHKIQKIQQSESNLKIDLSFSRDDLNLEGPKAYLSQTDLPAPLQLTTLKIYKESAPDTIYGCITDTVPYSCEMPFTNEEYGQNLIVNAEFLDMQIYTTKIRLPDYPRLSKIEITSPTTETKDKSLLEFNNVFADSYNVNLYTCYKPLNGQSPDEKDCMTSSYKLNKNTEEKWEITKENPLSYSAEIKLLGPTFKLDVEFDPSLYVSLKYEIQGKKEPFTFQGIEIQNTVSAKTVINL